MLSSFVKGALTAVAVLVMLPVLHAGSTATEPEFGLLVPGTGAEETYTYCIACHSERIVAQQGLTRSDWEELLVWMVEEHDMDEIEEPDYSKIIDYLARNYNTDRPNFPKP